MDPQAVYDQMAQQSNLTPLDFDFSDSLLNLEEVPTINIRSNTIIPEEAQNWSAYLPQIQTDMQGQGQSSPVFSTPSQASDSSHGYLSPHQPEPMTPSTASSHEYTYAAIRSPASSSGRIEPQSPGVCSLGLSVRALILVNHQL
jgi:hypothetical protein